MNANYLFRTVRGTVLVDREEGDIRHESVNLWEEFCRVLRLFKHAKYIVFIGNNLSSLHESGLNKFVQTLKSMNSLEKIIILNEEDGFMERFSKALAKEKNMTHFGNGKYVKINQ